MGDKPRLGGKCQVAEIADQRVRGTRGLCLLQLRLDLLPLAVKDHGRDHHAVGFVVKGVQGQIAQREVVLCRFRDLRGTLKARGAYGGAFLRFLGDVFGFFGQSARNLSQLFQRRAAQGVEAGHGHHQPLIQGNLYPFGGIRRIAELAKVLLDHIGVHRGALGYKGWLVCDGGDPLAQLYREGKGRILFHREVQRERHLARDPREGGERAGGVLVVV